MGLCVDNETHNVTAGTGRQTDRHNGFIKGFPYFKTGMQDYTYVCNTKSK